MPASIHRREEGEFALLTKVRSAVGQGGRGVVVGIGDDCAVLEVSRGVSAQVVTTDTMVEGVHFEASWLTPRELGVRAFRAALSDIAAMGARPRHVLLSLEIPGERRGFAEREALAVARAVAGEARALGATLVGGNVSAALRTGVTVTVLGETINQPLLRSGAKAGDLVFVTGCFGGAAAGWRVLEAGADAAGSAGRALTAAYRRPPVRIEFAADLAKRDLVHAMIDVSDGLLQDLGHVADESGVAIRIDANAVPLHRSAVRLAMSRSPRSTDAARAWARELALVGGEDYELAFTAPSSQRAGIEKAAARHRTAVAVIGVVARGRTGVTDPEGRPFALAGNGFDHLRPQRAVVAGKR